MSGTKRESRRSAPDAVPLLWYTAAGRGGCAHVNVRSGVVELPARAIGEVLCAPAAGCAWAEAEDAVARGFGMQPTILGVPRLHDLRAEPRLELRVVRAAIDDHHRLAMLQMHGCGGIRCDVARPACRRASIEVEDALHPHPPQWGQMRATVGVGGRQPVDARLLQELKGERPGQESSCFTREPIIWRSDRRARD